MAFRALTAREGRVDVTFPRGAPHPVWGAPPDVPYAPPAAPIILTVEAPTRVRSGECVPLTLVLRNPTDHDVWVELGGQSLIYDFLVYRPDGTAVWEWAMPIFEDIGNLEHLLRPGQAMMWRAFWNQRDSSGRPVTPGEYHIRGALSGAVCGRACPPDPLPDIRFMISPPHPLEVLP